jgi:DNA-binding LytR/AlgR family response regulator
MQGGAHNCYMKITINTDDRYIETEITVNCNRRSDDIENLLAAIRLADMKLTGSKNGQQHILDVTDIVYIDSTDKHTFLYTSVDVFESPFKLYELEAKLIDCNFMRASKNTLFNFNHIQSIKPDFDRRLVMTMTGGNKLIVSRQYAASVKEKLEAVHG